MSAINQAYIFVSYIHTSWLCFIQCFTCETMIMVQNIGLATKFPSKNLLLFLIFFGCLFINFVNIVALVFGYAGKENRENYRLLMRKYEAINIRTKVLAKKLSEQIKQIMEVRMFVVFLSVLFCLLLFSRHKIVKRKRIYLARPDEIYKLKVKNGNTGTMREIGSELTIMTLERKVRSSTSDMVWEVVVLRDFGKIFSVQCS